MKINSVNLRTYQSINALKSRTPQNMDPPAQPRQAKKLAGSLFAELLNREEINFLKENFSQVEERDNGDSKLRGGRIDILA